MTLRGRRWRKTKIVCTIGPATRSERTIKRLIEAGMDVARLNMSHGTPAEHTEYIRIVRGLSRKLGIEVSLLLDLPGPKCRVGKLPGGKVRLRKGAEMIVGGEGTEGGPARLPVTLPEIFRGVKTGQTILLDDGALQMKVTGSRGTGVAGRVTVGGELVEGRGVVVPGVPNTMPFVTEALRELVRFAMAERPDYIALSFVSRPEDVADVKKVLGRGGSDIPIIAKIERKEALKRFDRILEASDGIMVARGALGVEIPLEQVPLVQKEIIAECNRAAKPVITATEMLQSMVTSARPMRAEASDVANAIFDGTDAVMLSAETSIGRYPVRAVEMMDRISRETEKDLPYELSLSERKEWVSAVTEELISYNACLTAHSLQARAIVAFTQSGSTAARVAKYRPKPVVLAISPRDICGRLALYWGIHPYKRRIPASTTELFDIASDLARELRIAKKGDLIVITGGIPFGVAGSTNLLKVEKIA